MIEKMMSAILRARPASGAPEFVKRDAKDIQAFAVKSPANGIILTARLSDSHTWGSFCAPQSNVDSHASLIFRDPSAHVFIQASVIGGDAMPFSISTLPGGDMQVARSPILLGQLLDPASSRSYPDSLQIEFLGSATQLTREVAGFLLSSALFVSFYGKPSPTNDCIERRLSVLNELRGEAPDYYRGAERLFAVANEMKVSMPSIAANTMLKAARAFALGGSLEMADRAYKVAERMYEGVHLYGSVIASREKGDLSINKPYVPDLL